MLNVEIKHIQVLLQILRVASMTHLVRNSDLRILRSRGSVRPAPLQSYRALAFSKLRQALLNNSRMGTG